MHSFDIELARRDIQDLHSVDAVAAFFAKLGYDTSNRTPQTAANLAITEATAREINRIELLADQGGFFQVYAFEFNSITVASIKGIARAFKNRAGNFLLVLTSDYENIEFVLLDREIAEAKEPGELSAQQANIVPRRFSVDRRHPNAVHLRVLRRFTWTEADPFGQFDKLRFAYDVAYWSETHFNNRGLFSDYFLTERLRPKGSGELEFPEWQEDPKGAYQQLRGIYDQASIRFAGKTVADLVEMLYTPLLKALGFEIKPDKSSEIGLQQLRLFDPDAKRVLAICLVCPWGRELDRKDERHDPESPEVTPAFAVVDLLAKEKALWVILTNGKLWRLYSQSAHSRATNYYEVDLDEVLGRQGFQQDIQDSFRYFWLLFRAQSFRAVEIEFQGKRQSLSLLDRLLLGSQEYAKQLGDSLKERVFTRVFPVLAEGFIEHMRQAATARKDLDATALAGIFQGTLTLLYRLLFLLYAESRDLLPVHAPEYRQASLQRLKSDIAETAGAIGDDTDDRIKKHYSTQTYALWDRLKTLFGVIDKGSEQLNVPRYNGGLFQAERSNDDHSSEAEAARFLEREGIPDRHLARGIDLLARGLDPKRHDLVPVDYKSLGVRQLGSIYEGLLEFRLQIASQKLGVVKEKDREVYKSFSELTDKEKALSERHEKVVHKGRAYLENDKRERKATGSYYTPDHIVKFIVEHAVGPVLQQKFDSLRRELREAQQQRRDFFKEREEFVRRGLRPKPIEQGDLKGRYVVEKIFDIKILDPAMGSGHFLVEAVDFITDKMLEFLNAFPWNPVLVHLAAMRKTIQGQMDEQNIEIDFNRLTDINLLKRHVLKRCIYGVDLNPMAVELAKVSLWLDCFTLGAPLSFLDHHLHCGNSLIGATIAEVDALREAKGQLPLTGTSDWWGLAQAVQAMADIGAMPDITPFQVADSRKQYDSALADVEIFKRVLDLYTARWFVKDVTSKLGGKTVNIFDEMLRSGELFQWAHGRVESPVAHTAMAAAGLQAIRAAGSIADSRRFFHWELEFPEVFYGRRPGTQNAVERLPGGGFDAIIGNPPYDVLSSKELGRDVDKELSFFKEAPLYGAANSGKHNLYKFFVCKAATLLSPHRGMLSFIAPMSLLGNEQDATLRSLLFERTTLLTVEAFPQKDDPANRVFEEAKLSTTVFVVCRNGHPSSTRVRTHPGGIVIEASPAVSITLDDLRLFDDKNLPIPSGTQMDLDIARRILKIRDLKRLRDFCKAAQGEVNETTDGRRGFISDDPSDGPLILRGAAITLYVIREASQGEPIYLRKNAFLKAKPESQKARHYLQSRVGWQESSAQNNFRRLIAASIPNGHFCNHKINYVPQSDSRLPLDFVLAILNSKLSDWLFRLTSTSAAVSHYQVLQLPVPNVNAEISPNHWPSILEPDNSPFALAALPPEEQGRMPSRVAGKIEEMCRKIQEIEAARELKERSDRSQLAPQSQPIQDAIDALLFRCFGISRQEAEYISKRLQEML